MSGCTVFTKPCPICNRPSESLQVLADEVAAYEKRGVVSVFQSLTPQQREQLLTGTCPECEET